MKESYVKGLANHSDPESCGGARKSDGEAFTGEGAGRVLSPAIMHEIKSAGEKTKGCCAAQKIEASLCVFEAHLQSGENIKS